MRTKTSVLWLLGLGAVPLAFVACGDDGETGGGGSGGASTSSTGPSTSTSTATTSSTSTTATTTSTSSGMVDPSDACPGPVVTLSPSPTPVVVSGSTMGQTDDYKTYCADIDATTAAPDVVVQLDVTAACTLMVELDDVAPFDGAISIRHGQCEQRLGNDICYNNSNDAEIAAEHVEEGTHFIVIDGAAGTAGDFNLEISCTAPACGDGVQNPGEQCDYLPVQANDGCGDPGAANECQAEGQVAADTCPGTPVVINDGETVYLAPAPPAYTTADATDNHKGTCMPGGENGGKDEVFAVTVTTPGTITATLGQDLMDMNPDCTTPAPECWANYLYVKAADCAGGTEVACIGYDLNGVSTVTFNVATPGDYYFFVDGLNAEAYAAGPYVLRVEHN